MQQQTGIAPTTATPSPGTGTGPEAEASTAATIGHDFAPDGECSATVVMHIQRDRIMISGALDMGCVRTVSQCWKSIGASSWKRISGGDFVEAEDVIGLELAEYLDGLSLPDRVARMLPRPATAAASAAIAEAAKEVGNA